ncbi:MAG: hypothetical protein RI907_121 [Pseudomonadota bacterium]
MRLVPLAYAAALVATLAATSAQAAPSLIAIGNLSATGADLSGLSGNLENGVSASLLGGMGSGLAWAGGSTFLALPDRGPNAAVYNTAIDNTTSYISRFHTVDLALSATPSGSLPYTFTPTLQSTTLLWSSTPLNYGSAPAPTANTANQYYFTGRSDAFGSGNSGSTLNARLDPEGIRVSNNGQSVYISDEYGPYVYQFNRATGQRTNTYTLPSTFYANNLSANGAAEISGNTQGRVANKGMEGLAITPDGKTLVGFMQSPLIQDGGDGGRYNRIVTIDTVSGTTQQFAYDNRVGSKNYNSSEILALNATQFLVLERDGKGLGDGSNAAFKQLRLVDIAGATDVSNISGATALGNAAQSTTLFLDLYQSLLAAGFTAAQIPAKLEGAAFGQDIVEGGQTFHTLYIANDNDYLASVAGDNKFYVFKFTNADLSAIRPGATFAGQNIAAVPEPTTWAMLISGLAVVGAVRRRRA